MSTGFLSWRRRRNRKDGHLASVERRVDTGAAAKQQQAGGGVQPAGYMRVVLRRYLDAKATARARGYGIESGRAVKDLFLLLIISSGPARARGVVSLLFCRELVSLLARTAVWTSSHNGSGEQV